MVPPDRPRVGRWSRRVIAGRDGWPPTDRKVPNRIRRTGRLATTRSHLRSPIPCREKIGPSTRGTRAFHEVHACGDDHRATAMQEFASDQPSGRQRRLGRRKRDGARAQNCSAHARRRAVGQSVRVRDCNGGFTLGLISRRPGGSGASRLLSADALAVLASWPAAGPTLAFLQLLLGPTNAAFSGHLPLGILHPADELVTGQSRDVVPGIESRGVGDQRLAQISWKLVHHPTGHSRVTHRPTVVGQGQPFHPSVRHCEPSVATNVPIQDAREYEQAAVRCVS